jgi:hypothetical protein
LNTSAILRSIRRTAANHGNLPAAYDVAMRSVNKYVYFRTMQCLIIDTVQQNGMALPEHLRFLKLTDENLVKATATPEYGIQGDFLKSALRKGDECYAILDGDKIASYGWYARTATPLDPDDLILKFDSSYVYMYKGFTLDRYRGQRLHAIGMTRALAEYKQRGFAGLVSYVESNNFDSLKSCYRMGYRPCGRIRVVRIGGKYYIRPESECKAYGLEVRQRFNP